MRWLLVIAFWLAGCGTIGGRTRPEMKLNEPAEALVRIAESIADGDTLAKVMTKTAALGPPDKRDFDFCNSAGCVYGVSEISGNFMNAKWIKPNLAGRPDLFISTHLKFCALRGGWVIDSTRVGVFSDQKDSWGKTVPPGILYSSAHVYFGCTD